MMDDSCTAIVTGAAGGIGFASAALLLERGWNVVLADVREPEESQMQAIASAKPRFLVQHCDVTSTTDVEHLVETAIHHFGRIDALLNSAGADRRQPMHRETPEDFLRIVDLNLVGTFRASNAVAKALVRQRHAPPGGYSIVHLSSVNAVIATAGQVAYGATKGAIAQLTRTMAVELAPNGIRVNAVGPGTVRTPMLDALVAKDPAALNRILQRTPLGRVAEPVEIARVAAFLLGEEASYITGQTIYVDGGRMAQNIPTV
jgi:glucose 1-dehydrogenase